MFGKAIVFGPHMHNFAEISAEFLRGSAAVQVSSTRELGECLVDLVGDGVRRASLGAAARAIVEGNRGAKARTMAVITALAAAARRRAPRRRHAVPDAPAVTA